jgi:hypothetical protein
MKVLSLHTKFFGQLLLLDKILKKEKCNEFRTGVSGVSGGSLCNRPACLQLV